MEQVHSKFMVSVYDGVISQENLNDFANIIDKNDIAAKSIGIEYLEAQKKTVISVGFSEGSGYPITLKLVDEGVVKIDSEELVKKLDHAASMHDNIICHEFFIDEKQNLFVLLMCK